MRLPHHPKSIFGFPNVAVAQNGDVYRSFQLCNCVPRSVTMIELRRCSRVQSYSSTPLVFCHFACREKCQMVQIDTHSEFNRNGHSFRVTDSRANDIPQKIWLEWNRSTATLPSNLGNRTTEVHIQVIDTSIVHQTLHSFCNVVGIGPV